MSPAALTDRPQGLDGLTAQQRALLHARLQRLRNKEGEGRSEDDFAALMARFES